MLEEAGVESDSSGLSSSACLDEVWELKFRFSTLHFQCSFLYLTLMAQTCSKLELTHLPETPLSSSTGRCRMCCSTKELSGITSGDCVKNEERGFDRARTDRQRVGRARASEAPFEVIGKRVVYSPHRIGAFGSSLEIFNPPLDDWTTSRQESNPNTVAPPDAWRLKREPAGSQRWRGFQGQKLIG